MLHTWSGWYGYVPVSAYELRSSKRAWMSAAPSPIVGIAGGSGAGAIRGPGPRRANMRASAETRSERPALSDETSCASRSAMSDEGESDRSRGAFEREARLGGTHRNFGGRAPPPFVPAPSPETLPAEGSCTSIMTGVSKPTWKGSSWLRPEPFLLSVLGGTVIPCVRR